MLLNDISSTQKSKLNINPPTRNVSIDPHDTILTSAVYITLANLHIMQETCVCVCVCVCVSVCLSVCHPF